ncbi:MAG: hypothetical protein E2O85_00525 [Bacteroidetes bacterium]|nr:MAG: hypothetical protein E2O85_00525 [Bacteroidota bacterium]
MRRVLGVIAGLVTGFILVSLLEMLGHLIFPPPDGIEMMNREEIARVMDEIPLGGLISVAIAWFFGTLGAAFVATRVGQDSTMTSAYIIGGIEIGFGIFNFVVIPHPLWLIWTGLAAFVAGAYYGGKMGLWRDPDKVLDKGSDE